MGDTIYLAAVVLVCLLSAFEQSVGIKIYRSRRNAMEQMTGTLQETKQFFADCEQINNGQICRLAIDNEPIDEWSQCATTKPTASGDLPWWKGLLEAPVFVNSVIIINADFTMVGETDGLMEFNLLGNGNICYTHSVKTSFSTKTFQCNMLADEIEIRSHIAGSVLALCDVTVMGAQLKFHITQKPVQFEMKDCKQSSTRNIFTCNYAIDGFQSMDKDQGGCAVTHIPENIGPTEPPAFWWVSFMDPGMVQQVVLLTQDRNITQAEVSISNRICNTIHNADDNPIAHILMCNHFGGSMMVKYKRRDFAMILCEVQVHGFLVQLQPESRRTELGCFNDKADDPDMGRRPVSIVHMSLDKCDRACRRRKKKYMGLQWGMECWCADSFGRHGQAEAATDCQMPCEGKKITAGCGGKGKLQVYELK